MILLHSNSNESVADVPFFLIDIDPNSHATIRHLKDWVTCPGDNHKVCPHNFSSYLENDINGPLETGISCLNVKSIFAKAAANAIASYSLVFTIHAIFQTILAGPFGTSLLSFVQDGISHQFNFYATERIVVLLI